MSYHPPRLLGVALGILWLALLAGAAAFGMARLTSAGISTISILWIFLPLIGIPAFLLVAFRLYELLTAWYRLDRDGFRLRWGLAREQVPLAEIQRAVLASELEAPTRPGLALWWPGCVVGKRRHPELGEIEFFGSRLGAGMVVLILSEGSALAISPQDAIGFQQAFVEATRLGSLERLARESSRPDFIFAHLWNDRLARGLLMAGLLISIGLMGFLSAVGPNLPSEVPFGFDPAGLPDPLAPPGRLLLLPLIGGMTWLADLVVGALFYRSESNRLVAYVLWGASIATALLLWGGALHLVAAVG